MRSTKCLVCPSENSLQEARKTLRWRPHNALKYFQSHYRPLTNNPKDAALVSLSKFSQGGFQVSLLYDSL